jgi:hypothetical protein
MTTYAKLTRKQVLGLLDVAGVWHDALICHRDGSFTIRCGYHGSPVRAEANVAKLKKYTRAVILRERHAHQGLNTFIEVRFAFEASED